MSDQLAAAPTIRRYAAGDPAIQTAVGEKTAELIRLANGPGRGLFGPYVKLEAGPCIARIILDGPASGYVIADIAAEHGQLELASRRIDLAALDSQVIELRTVLPRPVADCEVRLYCEGDVHADISAVEIETPTGQPCGNGDDLDQRLRYFTAYVAPRVQGWLGGRVHQVIKIFGSIFDERNVRGNIAEIGVHHGLSFFLINALRRDDEQCFAIDLFDDQHLNIDKSGMGSRDIFVSHLDTLLPLEKPYVKILQRDSLTFSLQEFSNLFAPAGVKLFSVDGGHTAVHVCNDLALVQEVLVPGGIVAIDDFFGPHWPEVTEGFYQFMATRNRRMSPLLVFQNKLFLTTVSEHDLWLEHLVAGLTAMLGDDELRAGQWKYVDIAGTKALSHG